MHSYFQLNACTQSSWKLNKTEHLKHLPEVTHYSHGIQINSCLLAAVYAVYEVSYLPNYGLFMISSPKELWANNVKYRTQFTNSLVFSNQQAFALSKKATAETFTYKSSSDSMQYSKSAARHFIEYASSFRQPSLTGGKDVMMVSQAGSNTHPDTTASAPSAMTLSVDHAALKLITFDFIY